MSKKKELVPVEARAAKALAMQNRETELTNLAASTTDITSITNEDGYKQVRSARLALRRARLEIQDAGKTAREDATAFSKAVIAEEKRLVGLVEPEEKRLEALEVAEDDRIAAEKQAEIDREIARQAALQERVAELRGNRMLLPTSGSALIAGHIGDLEAIAVDDSFDECRAQAEAEKAAGLSWLRALHASALDHEAEQKRIADERVELARLRKEAADRATEEAARQKAIDDNNARIAAELKSARDKIDAEARRQADAAAEIERQQEELRKACEPAPLPPAAPILSDDVLLMAPTLQAVETPTATVSFGEGELRDADGALFGTTAEVTLTVGIGRNLNTRSDIPDMPDYDIGQPSRDELIEAIAEVFGVEPSTALEWLARHDWRAALAEAA